MFSSKDYPGAIPDHLVVSRKLLTDRPADVQKLVNAWFMTIDYMKKNPEKAAAIMSKRAGVSDAEYKSYEAGTTLFAAPENTKAFTSGSTRASLDAATKEVSTFLLDAGFIKNADASKLLEPKFVAEYVTSHK